MIDLQTARIVICVLLVALAFAIAGVITLLGWLRDARKLKPVDMTGALYAVNLTRDGHVVGFSLIGDREIVGDFPTIVRPARPGCRYPDCTCRFPGAICDANGRGA